jgi:hypothetical protein
MYRLLVAAGMMRMSTSLVTGPKPVKCYVLALLAGFSSAGWERSALVFAIDPCRGGGNIFDR